MSSNYDDNARQDGKWAVAVRDQDEAMDRRRFTRRVAVPGSHTKLGDVIDLTPAGMRVICGQLKPAERELLHLELMHPNGSVPVKCRAVWVQKMAPRRDGGGT